MTTLLMLNPLGLAVAVGLPAYIAVCIGLAKCIAFGMGTLPTPAERQIVADAFDGQRRTQKTPPL